jgi:hypothetical protein
MTQPEPIMIRVESRQLTHEESRQMYQRPAVLLVKTLLSAVPVQLQSCKGTLADP